LGRALDPLYDAGVTALDRLRATTAATRLGLAPRVAHLDSTSVYVDGRYNSEEEPDAEVLHLTRGDSRDHRPDRHQVMLELMVEPQAGLPLLRQPLSGHSRDVQEFGQGMKEHLAQVQTTDGRTSLVADRAVSSADNLQTFAETQLTWLTRVPATRQAAQPALAQVDPQALAPLMEGSRSRVLSSHDGGVAQRWGRIASEHRQAQAQRPVDKQLLTPRAPEVKAVKTRCRLPCACEAEARQALAILVRGVQATVLHEIAVHPRRRDGKRGRPGSEAHPTQVVYTRTGALASSLAARQALVDQPRCFLLATNALEEATLSPQAVLNGDKGPAQAERGFRCLKDPQFLASSLSLKKPERILALLLVMTVCLLGYAALESRIRQALQTHHATVPNQKGQRGQHPTARWVFHYFVGIHLRCRPGQWPLVLNLTEEPQHRLQRLGKPYERLSREIFTPMK
jgi:transposase